MLKGKKVIVTGSSSGIGFGIAKSFLDEGCCVVLNGLESGDKVQDLMSKFDKQQISYVSADLSHPEGCQILIDQALKNLGGIDILVNNAGVQFTSSVEDFPNEKWNLILALNLSSYFYTTKAVLPIMYKQKWGRLIHIASAHGAVGSIHKSAYVASKHGLIGFSKVVALEAAGTGVTSNCICPGFVMTPLVRKQIEDLSAKEGISFEEASVTLVSSKHPSKGFVRTEDVGAMAVFLSSNSGDQVTGSAYHMDGGWTAH